MHEHDLDLGRERCQPGGHRVTALGAAHDDGDGDARPELTAYGGGEHLGLGAVGGRRDDNDHGHPPRRQHPPQGVPEDGHAREGHERLGHGVPQT